MNERMTLQDEEQICRTRRSCSDVIFVIRQIKEKYLECNKSSYKCLIELKTVFNRVIIKYGIHLLYNRGIPLNQPMANDTSIRQRDFLSTNLLFNHERSLQ